jgi:pimeloyl-ACP methyl ester carboxylesterase
MAYLQSRKDMKGKKIGLAGHSEGGLIAPMVAAENKDVDFIVLLAGPGILTQELLLLQQKEIGELQGVPASFLETNNRIAKALFEYLENNMGLDRETLKAGLIEFLDKSYEALTDEEKNMIGPKESFLAQQSGIATSEWYLYFIGIDPDSYLARVKCPVLAVNGELDLQVSSEKNLEGIRKSLEKAKNKDYTIHEFEGLNHLFQQAETGSPAEYYTLDETFNVKAMYYISDWILAL